MPNITGNILKKINNFFRKMKISIAKLPKLIKLFFIPIITSVLFGLIICRYTKNFQLALSVCSMVFLFTLGIIIFIDNFFKTVKELWYENKLIVISGGITFTLITIIIVKTNNTPEDMTKHIIVYFTTVGALLLAFIPQILININDRYRPKGISKPYNPEALFKKIKDISYFLLIYIGNAMLSILISPAFLIFSDKTTKIIWDIKFNKLSSSLFFNSYVRIIKGAKESLYYDYFMSNNIILKSLSLLYIMFLSSAVVFLILGFLEIFLILRYFYVYEYDFKNLKLEYKNWSKYEIDWVIKNNLTKKFKNYKNKAKFEDYYEIWGFIYKFEEKEKELEAQNVKKKSKYNTKSKLFDYIMKNKDEKNNF